MVSSDTIYALSSGSLPAGVAVVRLSGPGVRFALETIVGKVPPPRRLVFAAMRAGDGTLLDRGMAVFCPAPASSTGEDMAEFHLHGSRAVVAAISAALSELPSMRMAEAGEFTRRAFLEGKLDLAQAEGLGDLINAETESQRRFALQTADGVQSRLYHEWHERLLHARAMIEAELDFSDEAEVPGSVADQIWEDMSAMAGELAVHLQGQHQAEIIRDGFMVVLLGPPNVGKSSLINALAKRDVAIVSDEPGTTRDLIEVTLDLAGVKVRLVDTAGLRDDASSKVEHIGMQRAVRRASAADLVLVLDDGRGPGGIPKPAGVDTLQVMTKSDLNQGSAAAQDLAISAVTGQGLEELIALIRDKALQAVSGVELLPARERHIGYLRSCFRAIERAASMTGHGLEERAELLRGAAVDLGRITGATDVEDLLGKVFANFCIGK